MIRCNCNRWYASIFCRVENFESKFRKGTPSFLTRKIRILVARCAIFISWIGINTTRYVDWLNSKSSIESKRIKICWDKNLHGIVDKQFTINSLSRFSLVEKKKKNFSQLCNESNTACACVCVTTTGNTQYAKVDYLLRINLSDALLFRHQRLVPFYRVVHSRCSKAKYSSTVRVQCQDAV